LRVQVAKAAAKALGEEMYAANEGRAAAPGGKKSGVGMVAA